MLMRRMLRLLGLLIEAFGRFLCSSRLPGGGVTFFAAAKKVTKESRFFNQTLQIDTATGFTFARRLFVASALTIHLGPGTHAICGIARMN
jgi:hypothetical protein